MDARRLNNSSPVVFLFQLLVHDSSQHVTCFLLLLLLLMLLMLFCFKKENPSNKKMGKKRGNGR